MKLTEPQKKFIVENLACHDTPQQVADAFKEEFGATITRQQVEEYDPTKRKVSKKWTAVWEAARKNFEEDCGRIPIAKKSYRLRQLNAILRRAQSRGNYPAAMQAIEQAAKEMGEVYSIRRELTGKGGAPLIPDRSLEDLTEAQLVALVAQIAEGGGS